MIANSRKPLRLLPQDDDGGGGTWERGAGTADVGALRLDACGALGWGTP
jgi:hypothetical protein